MQIAENKKDGLYVLRSKELNMFNPTEMKVLSLLAKKPTYPKNIAKQLKIHEQNIYYYVKRLQKQGVIKIIKKEEHGAYLANIYALTSQSFFVKFSNLKKTEKIPNESDFLEPFIENGELNAIIIVGSPDPHGPERARSRDAYYGIDLGIFIGTFLSRSKAVVNLDTDIRDTDLKDNLIIIGGPVINRVAKLVNDKMPIRFDTKKNIYSSITKKTYKQDDCGIVAKIINPWNKEKYILLIAGKRYSGTKAAILAFIKKFDELSKKQTRIVEGIDNDGDGIVDDVRILE